MSRADGVGEAAPAPRRLWSGWWGWASSSKDAPCLCPWLKLVEVGEEGTWEVLAKLDWCSLPWDSFWRREGQILWPSRPRGGWSQGRPPGPGEAEARNTAWCLVSYFVVLSASSPISVLDLKNNPVGLAILCSQRPWKAWGWVSEQKPLGTVSYWNDPGVLPGVSGDCAGLACPLGLQFSNLVLPLSTATLLDLQSDLLREFLLLSSHKFQKQEILFLRLTMFSIIEMECAWRWRSWYK